MQTWITIDKKDWLLDISKTEPDKACWIDEATKLNCMILRNSVGVLCGYVGVPPEHPLHGIDYNNIRIPKDDYIEVHGGLTFSDFSQKTKDISKGLCHSKEEMVKILLGEKELIWWFGFDCGHLGDIAPKLKNIFKNESFKETYRTFKYVRLECIRLAQQIFIAVGFYQKDY